MTRRIDPAEYEALLRVGFAGFAEGCFHELDPRADVATSWRVRAITAKLTAAHQGKIHSGLVSSNGGAGWGSIPGRRLWYSNVACIS